ncbi:MAG TPA: hypothetical protein VGN98_02805 [Tianweitania sediminis]|nr:hypothetical protein [Tianweitania sediminis]
MNTAERITSAGRPAITRRSLLGGLAAATVTTPAVAVPILPTSAKRTPQEAWAAFVATLDGMIPEGDRLQVFGSATCVRAEIYHTEIEQVHPRVRMPVERIVASYWMNDGVWQSEGVYA